MKNRTGVYKDTHSYLVTAEHIEGPWSEPIYLNSSGFDPALFHDEDGKKWLLNIRWDFRKGQKKFNGILLQEYCHKEKKLVGQAKVIVEGADWVIEGSNMYKRNGYYYIILAEGGTGYKHSATLIRSKCIHGPYEKNPNNPILTTNDKPEHPMQKAGHASIVETQNGDWYMAHLYSRPLKDRMLCPLGRETALQKVEWTQDGWLRLAGGGHTPKVEVEAPLLSEYRFEKPEYKNDFDQLEWDIRFSTLRVPAEEAWVSLKERPGYLRIVGRESLTSLHDQSMVARRVEHFYADVETCVEFSPENYMQMAGLIYWYDEFDHFYLRISHDEQLGKNIGIIASK